MQGQDIHSHNTRSNSIFRQVTHRLQIADRLPMQAGIKLLNKLPIEVKGILPDYALFANKLKQHLLLTAPYSVAEFMNTV